ncbi:hypothetical protein [Micromonospora maritima]|uniref:hypothetical protein n=1 Tax=Micromonospora maritima TaxID=986711 RepID=UPI00157DA1DF|nr:hypothetical protein [Micromonospora maritima]
MSTTSTTTFALPSLDAGREREARSIRKGWWILLDPTDRASWAQVAEVVYKAVGGTSDRYRKPTITTTGGLVLPCESSTKLRCLNGRELTQLKLDGVDPANPVSEAPDHTRLLVSFARAVQAGAVSERPRGTATTESVRRPIGGARNIARMSFVRCGELTRVFERAGLAVRPIHNLPADWKLTEVGEQWLAEGLAKGLLDELPQRVAA